MTGLLTLLKGPLHVLVCATRLYVGQTPTYEQIGPIGPQVWGMGPRVKTEDRKPGAICLSLHSTWTPTVPKEVAANLQTKPKEAIV